MLGPSLYLNGGIRVYFFREHAELDMFWFDILENFQVLIDQEVTFELNGYKKGIVTDLEFDSLNLVPIFHISNKSAIYIVSFFNVFLNKQQAKCVL